jgi:hypothetical protein
MVIDAKLPPDDSAPLPAPPPAYAPPSEVSQGHSPNPPQQYPPSSSQNYSGSPTVLPQWNTPGTGSQSVPPEEWVGHQYRNQRGFSRGPFRFLDHTLFLVYAQCARGNHDETTSFGLCGIICAILLFPIGLIFLWYAMIYFLSSLKWRLMFHLASIRRKNAHDVGCGCLARLESDFSPFPSPLLSPCNILDIFSYVLLFLLGNVNVLRTDQFRQ